MSDVRTATLLFTDIEGSTSLWERVPDRMRDAVALHFKLLHGAIEDHGGEVVKSTGDGVLAKKRMCLCGMLAAEYATLPEAMQQAIREFFDGNETWLAGVLDDGRAAGELAFSGSARDVARHWVATLEGAMLLARSYGEPSRLTTAVRRLIATHATR